MSITKEQFDSMETVFNRKGEASVNAELFLKENSNRAFTTNEINSYLKSIFPDKNYNTSGILKHLEKRGVLEHKSPYWKFKKELLKEVEK
jgi:hypothetical protein